MFADTLTGGTIAAGIFMAVVVICALGWLIVFALMGEWLIGWVGPIAVIICGLVWFWGMWPFSYDYHHWVDTEGTVAKIDSRLVPSGDSGMEEKIVITFTDGRLRGVTETRATALKPGDKVHLRCKKAYDFGVPRSSHGWDCKWISGGETL
jgi:hypothetical protein